MFYFSFQWKCPTSKSKFSNISRSFRFTASTGIVCKLDSVLSVLLTFDLQMFGKDRNYFLSPASIKVTLAMLLEGAKHQTAQELMTALGLSSSSAKEALQPLLEDLNV